MGRMTEQEALEILKNITKNTRVEDDEIIYSSEYVKAYEMAIKALEEIQAYRAIGTVEEIKSFFNENRKAGYKHGYADGYAQAIDEFANEILKKSQTANRSVFNRDYTIIIHKKVIDEIAEQMKAGE